MSELLLFNAISLNFILCHGENKLNVNEMMLRSALFQTNTLSLIFIVTTSLCFSSLMLRAYREKQQIPIAWSLV